MAVVVYKSESRGYGSASWLDTRYSFSFANYQNPERMNFGALRVINDDTIAPGKGFGMHPHDNMEIVTIVLAGSLEHQDNMGNRGVIRAGEVQHMSAGTGVVHAEFNASETEPVKILQIWVEPAKRNVKPAYGQASLADLDIKNRLVPIVAGRKGEAPLTMNQNARFLFGHLEPGQKLTQPLPKGMGAFVFLLSGHMLVDSRELATRDAAEVVSSSSYELMAQETSQVLIIEVPV